MVQKNPMNHSEAHPVTFDTILVMTITTHNWCRRWKQTAKTENRNILKTILFVLNLSMVLSWSCHSCHQQRWRWTYFTGLVLIQDHSLSQVKWHCSQHFLLGTKATIIKICFLKICWYAHWWNIKSSWKSYLTQMCFDNISLCGSNQAVKYYTGGINLKDSPWMKGLNTGSIICQDQQAQN